jgi:NAD(P)H dehydrogenase (quinone)
MLNILVLYYSQDGSVHQLAQQIGRGINSIDGCEAVLRTVPNINQKNNPDFAPEVELNEIEECHALALGSPTHFGNMSGVMKIFIDSLTSIWIKGSLENKLATVFTSTSSIHGGNEATLLTMQIPLQHLGMITLGVPYSVSELKSTQTGGTPYGASHTGNDINLSSDEQKIAFAQGKRLAELTIKLNA